MYYNNDSLTFIFSKWANISNNLIFHIKIKTIYIKKFYKHQANTDYFKWEVSTRTDPTSTINHNIFPSKTKTRIDNTYKIRFIDFHTKNNHSIRTDTHKKATTLENEYVPFWTIAQHQFNACRVHLRTNGRRFIFIDAFIICTCEKKHVQYGNWCAIGEWPIRLGLPQLECINPLHFVSVLLFLSAFCWCVLWSVWCSFWPGKSRVSQTFRTRWKIAFEEGSPRLLRC